MFHFPAFPPTPYEFGMQVTRHDSRRVTPFGHPGITARLTAPPGLSQPPTSFIGPWYQGIHRPPLPTYPQTHKPRTNHRTPKCSRPLCKSQPTTNPPPATTPPGTATSHAWHQDNNPTTNGRTVVPSEPQQGVCLAAEPRPDRPALSPPSTPPTPQGTDHAQGRTRPDPATAGPDSPVSPPMSTPTRHPRTRGFSGTTGRPLRPVERSLERR
jgi:hypothetical protein